MPYCREEVNTCLQFVVGLLVSISIPNEVPALLPALLCSNGLLLLLLQIGSKSEKTQFAI